MEIPIVTEDSMNSPDIEFKDLPVNRQTEVLKMEIQMHARKLYTALHMLAERSPEPFEVHLHNPLPRGLGRIISVEVKLSRQRDDDAQ